MNGHPEAFPVPKLVGIKIVVGRLTIAAQSWCSDTVGERWEVSSDSFDTDVQVHTCVARNRHVEFSKRHVAQLSRSLDLFARGAVGGP